MVFDVVKLSTLKFYDDLGIHVIHQMHCVGINKTPSNSHDQIKYAVNKTSICQRWWHFPTETHVSSMASAYASHVSGEISYSVSVPAHKPNGKHTAMLDLSLLSRDPLLDIL